MSTRTQPRRPAGTPVGGEYDTTAGGGPAADLGATMDPAQPMARWASSHLGPQDALRMKGKGWFGAGGSARNWWARHAELIANAEDAGFVPRMAKDGKYLGIGSRRVSYRGANMEVTMPSVSSARRFAAELGGDPATFDMPVSVTHASGGHVEGWVRVARTPDGRWGAVTLGGEDMNEGVRDRVAESVTAMLESRHLRMGLSQYTDIIDRTRARQAAEGLELAPQKSRAVKSMGYEPTTQTMFIEHHEYTRKGDGVHMPAKVYGYQGIGEVDYKLLQSAPARGSGIGAELHSVRSTGERVEVGHCDACGRYFPGSVTHRCPVTVI